MAESSTEPDDEIEDTGDTGETGETEELVPYSEVQAVYDPSLTIYSDLQNKQALCVPVKDRVIQNKMTKFERARILSERTEQLRRGAKTAVNVNDLVLKKDCLYYYYIACSELEQKKIPLLIRRYYPDGRYELWDANELI